MESHLYRNEAKAYDVMAALLKRNGTILERVAGLINNRTKHNSFLPPWWKAAELNNLATAHLIIPLQNDISISSKKIIKF